MLQYVACIRKRLGTFEIIHECRFNLCCCNSWPHYLSPTNPRHSRHERSLPTHRDPGSCMWSVWTKKEVESTEFSSHLTLVSPLNKKKHCCGCRKPSVHPFDLYIFHQHVRRKKTLHLRLAWKCEGDCKHTPSLILMAHRHLAMCLSLGTYFTYFYINTCFLFIFGTCNHKTSLTWPATSSEWHVQLPKVIRSYTCCEGSEQVMKSNHRSESDWPKIRRHFSSFFLRGFTVSPFWTDIVENTSVCRREFVKTSFFCLDNKLERKIV